MSFDCDHELGEIPVADDASELLLGDEHPGGPALAHVSVVSAFDVALRERTISIMFSHGFMEDSVLASCPLIPSRISVNVSRIPWRSEAAASSQARSSVARGNVTRSV